MHMRPNQHQCEYTTQPLVPNTGRLRDLEEECGMGSFDQHDLGVVVHHGLASTYSNLVSDPALADLFFIPDHFNANGLLHQGVWPA